MTEIEKITLQGKKDNFIASCIIFFICIFAFILLILP